LGSARSAVPEFAVIDHVERNADRFDARRALTEVSALVLVAKVDDRADAVPLDRSPAVWRERVERIGAHDRSPARLLSASNHQAAEIAGVEAALPIEVAIAHVRSDSKRSCA